MYFLYVFQYYTSHTNSTYITAKMGKEPNYTDEDFAKIKLQVEQRKKTTEILKVFLSGFFFFCTREEGVG